MLADQDAAPQGQGGSIAALVPIVYADLARLAPGVTVTRRPVPVDLKAIFAANVKQARLAAGISQRDLAKLAGVARSYMFAIEQGSANVTLDVVDLFAQALGKDVTDLLRPPAPPPPRTRKK